jgi:hypothetical protein
MVRIVAGVNLWRPLKGTLVAANHRACSFKEGASEHDTLAMTARDSTP